MAKRSLENNSSFPEEEGAEDTPFKDSALVAKKRDEFIPVSPMGTEGCLWEEDFHYLLDEEDE